MYIHYSYNFGMFSGNQVVPRCLPAIFHSHSPTAFVCVCFVLMSQNNKIPYGFYMLWWQKFWPFLKDIYNIHINIFSHFQKSNESLILLLLIITKLHVCNSLLLLYCHQFIFVIQWNKRRRRKMKNNRRWLHFLGHHNLLFVHNKSISLSS